MQTFENGDKVADFLPLKLYLFNLLHVQTAHRLSKMSITLCKVLISKHAGTAVCLAQQVMSPSLKSMSNSHNVKCIEINSSLGKNTGNNFRESCKSSKQTSANTRVYVYLYDLQVSRKIYPVIYTTDT